MADWIMGISHHHLGQLATARLYMERSLAGDTLESRQAMRTQFGYDRRIPTIGVFSNLDWLEGRPDEAVRRGMGGAWAPAMAEEATERAILGGGRVWPTRKA